jgi:chain length determinant protein EpsF
MNPQQIIKALLRRWWLIALSTVIVGSIAAVITLRQPKVYSSHTSLLLDVKSDPLVATFMPAIASPAFMATQAHIIKSDRVAQSVISRLGLTKNADAVARWRQATSGKVPLDIFYSSLLEQGLSVEPASGTSVLNISFTAADPKFAAVVANAYAQAYIDFSVDLRVEPAKQYATWFDQRQKELRSELEAAKARFAEAQKNKGVVMTGDQSSDETARLQALIGQLAAAMAEKTDAVSRAKNSGQETSPDVAQSGAVQGLRSQLATLEARFTELGNKFGTNHPEYRQLDLQIAAVRKQLDAEMRRVSGVTATVNAVSSQKIADLQTQIEAQKQRVIAARAGGGELDFLSKDVETAQRAYDAVAQRRAQLALESQSEQAGARILSRAVEPLAPSKPNVRANIMAGIGMGGLLGAAIILLLEFLDRRIRDPLDLQQVDGIPLLMVLDTPPSPRKLPFSRRPALTLHR